MTSEEQRFWDDVFFIALKGQGEPGWPLSPDAALAASEANIALTARRKARGIPKDPGFVASKMLNPDAR